MMTAKDFNAIANVISTELNKPFETESERGDRKIVLHNVASKLADVAAESNPRFNRHRFMLAAGFAPVEAGMR